MTACELPVTVGSVNVCEKQAVETAADMRPVDQVPDEMAVPIGFWVPDGNVCGVAGKPDEPRPTADTMSTVSTFANWMVSPEAAWTTAAVLGKPPLAGAGAYSPILP